MGSWEGFTSDITIVVQTDTGIPPTNRPPYYYVVLCRTSLSLLKPFVTEERFNIPEVWKSDFSSPSVQIAIVWLREMQQSEPRLFLVFFSFFVFLKPLPSIFSGASFSFSFFLLLSGKPYSSLCLNVLTEAVITAPNNVNVSTGEHNERLWEVLSNPFILQHWAIMEKTQWDFSFTGSIVEFIIALILARFFPKKPQNVLNDNQGYVGISYYYLRIWEHSWAV